MYPLLDLCRSDEQQVFASIVQGSDSVLHFSRADDIKPFVDQLLTGPSTGADIAFASGARRFTARRHVDAARIGLVSDQPTLLRTLSVYDNLELVAHRLDHVAAQPFHARVLQAMEETGLLAEINLARTVDLLPWPVQIEITFLQAWLVEPQWLIFDSVFEHADSAALTQLPLLFRRRHPLRAITYLQSGKPLAPSFNIRQEIIL